MKVKSAKKKVKIFDDLKQALSDALDYQQGKKTG
jgi:DNA-binding transcriptional regulator YiaG